MRARVCRVPEKLARTQRQILNGCFLSSTAAEGIVELHNSATVETITMALGV